VSSRISSCLGAWESETGAVTAARASRARANPTSPWAGDLAESGEWRVENKRLMDWRVEAVERRKDYKGEMERTGLKVERIGCQEEVKQSVKPRNGRRDDCVSSGRCKCAVASW
jgi:hypothetical protein